MENIIDNNNVEQILAVPTTAAEIAGASDKNDKNSIGKFKSKEDLLEAYNSLEAEFTRRSQKIKELENRVNIPKPPSKWETRVNELTKQYPIANTVSDEITEYIEKNKELLDDDNCLEKALLSVLATKVNLNAEPIATTNSPKRIADSPSINKQDIISEYINSLQSDTPIVAPRGGEIPVSLPNRPHNITEAGRLAVSIIKNYKN